MKKAILYIYCCFLTISLLAQPQNNELGDIQVASPEAAALGKYVDIPVGTFTGAASNSISIHTLTEGSLSLPISLNYHGSGIRAAETASWAGLGWNVNATGIISRTVLGKEDEKQDGFLVSDHDYDQPPIQTQVAGNNYDGEPDLFSFSLPNGASGKFIIDKDINKIIQFPKSELKIVTPSTDLDDFTIITPDGTKYIFGEVGTNNYSGFTSTEDIFAFRSSEDGQARNVNNAPQRTEWNLRKIESYDGEYEINFTYKNKSYGLLSPSSERFSKTFYNSSYTSSGDVFLGFPNLTTAANFGSSEEEEYFGQQQVALSPSRTGHLLYGHYQKFETKQLETITTSTTRVEFLEGGRKRKDIHGDVNTGIHTLDVELNNHDKKPLRKIRIKPKTGNGFCKTFELNHSYFLYNTDTTDLTETYTFDYRLKLDAVREVSCKGDGVSVPPYTFEYYNDPTKSYPYMPFRLTKAVDAYGYHNGVEGNNTRSEDLNIPSTTLTLTYANQSVPLNKGGANRNSFTNPMRYGSLKRINYPEGGYTELDLEANAVKQVAVDTTLIRQGVYQRMASCDQNNINGDCCPDITTSRSIDFTSDYIRRGVFRVLLKDIRDTDNPNSAFCNDDVPNSWNGTVTITLTPSGSTTPLIPHIQLNSSDMDDSLFVDLDTLYPGMTQGFYTVTIQSAFCWGGLNFWQEEYTDASFDKLVGGLRVKEKKTYDSQNQLLRAKTYEYDNFSDAGFSSGLLFKTPVFGQIIASDYNITSGPYGNSTTYYARMEFTNNSIVPLTDRQGYHIGYQNVVEREANGAFTTYVHKARSMDREIGPVLRPYPTAPLPYFYDNGELLRSNQGSFSDTIAAMRSEGNVVFENLTSNQALRAEVRSTQGGGPPLAFTNIFSYQQTGFYRDGKVINTLDGVTTETTYGYTSTEQVKRPSLVKVINSDGVEYETEYTYPRQLAQSSPNDNEAVYQDMLNRNMVAIPIITLQKSIKNGTTEITGGTRNEYSMFNTSGANVGNMTANAVPRPYTFEQREVTWNLQNVRVDEGWRTLGTIGAYSNNGKPAEFTRDGWEKETYEWNGIHNLLKKREYKDFVWRYNYHPGTRLLSEIIDIDGQDTGFEYDGLQRLSSINERDGNIVTTFDYFYKNQNNGRPQNHTATTKTYTPVTGSGLNTVTTLQYFDEIGRPVQTVNQGYASNGDDVINAQMYDAYGRLVKQYEPFATGQTNGNFVSAIPNGTEFTLTEFEESPLNRPIRVTPPDWYPTHTEYGNNTTAITVPGTSINYAAGQLNTVTTIEPDGNGTKTGDRTITYTDKRGRLIVKRQQNQNGSQQVSTYTTYDEKDRTRLIIPPGATASSTNLIYRYFYDGYNNIIRKEIPGSAQMLFEYNTRELPIARQDGNMRNDGVWMSNIYDDYGRITQTGIGTTAGTIASGRVWTETFYDGMDGDPNVPDIDLNSEPIYYGKVRKTNIAILNGNQVQNGSGFPNNLGPNGYLSKIYTYDSHGRVVTETGSNHLGGTGYCFFE
ncbi:MAG: DUF6443 domain-containing protein, partial [Bacteroidota bacterium]